MLQVVTIEGITRAGTRAAPGLQGSTNNPAATTRTKRKALPTAPGARAAPGAPVGPCPAHAPDRTIREMDGANHGHYFGRSSPEKEIVT